MEKIFAAPKLSIPGRIQNNFPTGVPPDRWSDIWTESPATALCAARR